MKKYIIAIVLVAGCLAAVSANIIYRNSMKLSSVKPIEDDAPAYITAHTGAYGTTDNTLASAEEAVKRGAEIIEVDIWRSDGILFISHDGIEKGKTAADYPPLSGIFGIAKAAGVRVNCDLKHDGLMQPVVDLALLMDMENLIIFTGTVTQPQLESFKGRENTFSIYLNMSFFGEPYYLTKKACEGIADNIEIWKPYFADVGINLNYKSVNKNLYTAMKERDINISVFTVTDGDTLEKLKKYDFYNITQKCNS